MKETVPEYIQDWFSRQQEVLAIEVKEVGLGAMKDWVLGVEGNVPYDIRHVSGKYHRGVFLHAWDRVRNQWVERFLVAPVAQNNDQKLYGVALLARYQGKYLVQAKAEPGNPTTGHVQLTSTIHASSTNIVMKLSGEVPFTWMYDSPRCVHLEVCQDGAQLYLKKNNVSFIELDEAPESIPDNYAWASLEEIRDFAERGLISEHLMEGLGASLFMK